LEECGEREELIMATRFLTWQMDGWHMVVFFIKLGKTARHQWLTPVILLRRQR
jgi:hypothetical protein